MIEEIIKNLSIGLSPPELWENIAFAFLLFLLFGIAVYIYLYVIKKKEEDD